VEVVEEVTMVEEAKVELKVVGRKVEEEAKVRVEKAKVVALLEEELEGLEGCGTRGSTRLGNCLGAPRCC